MIKKMILFAIVLLTTSVAAENEPTYDPINGSLDIPEVIFLGQNQETEYVVKMQQREGLVFEVTEATPDEGGIIDSDDNRVTYDPDTGLVEIPLIFVRSIEDPEEFTLYSVKMQQKEEGSNFFEAFDPVEISLDDLDGKRASQSVSPKNRVSLKKSTSRVTKCAKKIYVRGRVRSIRRYFWRPDCPSGWHPIP